MNELATGPLLIAVLVAVECWKHAASRHYPTPEMPTAMNKIALQTVGCFTSSGLVCRQVVAGMHVTPHPQRFCPSQTAV